MAYLNFILHNIATLSTRNLCSVPFHLRVNQKIIWHGSACHATRKKATAAAAENFVRNQIEEWAISTALVILPNRIVWWRDWMRMLNIFDVTFACVHQIFEICLPALNALILCIVNVGKNGAKLKSLKSNGFDAHKNPTICVFFCSTTSFFLYLFVYGARALALSHVEFWFCKFAI